MAATGALCASILILATLPAGAASPAEEVVRGAIDSMRTLPATAGHPAAQRKLLDSIDNALALDLLAKQALGPQWDKLSGPERQHFVGIFTQSLEKLAFPRAAAALSEVKVNYVGENLKTASTVVVKTSMSNEGGGQIPMDFDVAKRGTRWQIIDVVMDGASLSNVMATRIQSSLANEGYQKLVEELQGQISGAGGGS